jgi:hypothetical protein
MWRVHAVIGTSECCFFGFQSGYGGAMTVTTGSLLSVRTRSGIRIERVNPGFHGS